jgi:hypothetical protein
MATSYEKRHGVDDLYFHRRYDVRAQSGGQGDSFLLLEDDDGSATSFLLLEDDPGDGSSRLELQDSN